ncbi:FadR/GntR family transcriptional regulator [Geodermatophilus sp. DSM 44513]|uniref:FadR/GntR family transcriptional regulator n=1 Tax=Geodermatophilus sp. DSM 44513 TaxID=1528104 RepID=UPI00126F3A50|nr:FadR/GntR family transcriptional regulator [Geodermatophilus sp. DSM 44513]WNV75206.1 FadR/GntR family transcriptional regulator [Geodermatophilus sp. DSM 44513]
MERHRETPAAAEVLAVQPVFVRTAAGQVVDQLRAAIIDGRLRSGDRLPSEQQLAQDFGVSRGTVREAIRTLAASNLVTSTRGATGGTFVTTPRAGELAERIGEQIGLWFRAGNISLAEVQHARHVLERECVALAALHRTEEDLSAMRRPIETSRDPTLGEDAWLATDVEFHTAVSKSAKNSILELAMTAVHLVRPRTNRLLLKELRRDCIADQHWAMYEGIRDRDAEAATAAFEQHFSYLHEMQQRALADADAERMPVLDIPAEAGPASVSFRTADQRDAAG